MIQWIQYYQYYSILFSPFIHSHLNFVCWPLNLVPHVLSHFMKPYHPSHQLHNILSKKVKCAWMEVLGPGMGQCDCPALARFYFSVHQWISVQNSFVCILDAFSGSIITPIKHTLFWGSHMFCYISLIICDDSTAHPCEGHLSSFLGTWTLISNVFDGLCSFVPYFSKKNDNLVPILESHSVEMKNTAVL